MRKIEVSFLESLYWVLNDTQPNTAETCQSIDDFMTTLVGRRFPLFVTLAANVCWWVNVSNHGSVKVNGCPHMWCDMRKMKNSSGFMETKPFIISKVLTRFTRNLLSRSDNSLSLWISSVQVKRLNIGKLLVAIFDTFSISLAVFGNETWMQYLNSKRASTE